MVVESYAVVRKRTISLTKSATRPDNCDGTYEANCDDSREYSNITAIVEESGRSELLSDMNKYWKDYQGDDESFWEHEWNKHGISLPFFLYVHTKSEVEHEH